MKLKQLVRKILNRIYYSFCSIHDDLLDFLKDDEEVKAFNQKVSDTIKAHEDKLARYQQLMHQVKEIQTAQNTIQEGLNSPSKGSLDSAYKNKQGQVLLTMEEEKYLLFNEILDLGFDPIMRVWNRGVSTEMLLSELVAKGHDDLHTAQNKKPHLHLVENEEVADE